MLFRPFHINYPSVPKAQFLLDVCSQIWCPCILWACVSVRLHNYECASVYIILLYTYMYVCVRDTNWWDYARRKSTVVEITLFSTAQELMYSCNAIVQTVSPYGQSSVQSLSISCLNSTTDEYNVLSIHLNFAWKKLMISYDCVPANVLCLTSDEVYISAYQDIIVSCTYMYMHMHVHACMPRRIHVL